jgi:hypothetical protein
VNHQFAYSVIVHEHDVTNYRNRYLKLPETTRRHTVQLCALQDTNRRSTPHTTRNGTVNTHLWTPTVTQHLTLPVTEQSTRRTTGHYLPSDTTPYHAAPSYAIPIVEHTACCATGSYPSLNIRLAMLTDDETPQCHTMLPFFTTHHGTDYTAPI